MDKDYLQLILTLNECEKVVIQAAKNVSHMKNSLKRDNTITEYRDKLQRMRQELPYLITRANVLQQTLEQFNRIAMS